MPNRRELDSVGEPAFAINHRQVITEWNAPAEKAFGHRAKSVLGRRCHEVLCGEDIHGNAFCRESCNILRLVRRAVPVRSFVVSVRCASGERVPVRMAILPRRVGRDRPGRIVHLALASNHSIERSASPCAGDAGRPGQRAGRGAPRLTRSEIEMLRQVALGLTTSAIAAATCISPATVRTHVRNLLRKLGAHTRAEALHIALREGLLP